jgi:DNA primase catalytic core
MGRIPDDEIERLKRETSVAELARARGVELETKGADLHGRCPFHDDKTPSFVVTPATNLWHCLGACQAGGSAIDFVMRSEGLSFRHAVELLRRDAGLAVRGTSAGATAPPKLSRKRRLEPIVAGAARDAEVLGRVVEHYQAALIESPEAVAYLEARGLKHPEVIERFKLGYANRTIGYRLGTVQTKAGAEGRARLQEVGVLRASGHEHLNGSLVIPLFDAEGRVVQLYGRKLRDDLRDGTPKHLYLTGPQRGVFNREGLASAAGEAIVCEALIDALTFWVAGFEHVTSGYGVEGVTEEILDALEAADVRVVKIAFDRDEAGDRGAEKLAERLAARGMESHRVLFPRGMDANAYALKVGPAAQSLGLVLRQAEWMRGGRRAAMAEASSTDPPDVEPAPSLVASPSPPPLPEPEVPASPPAPASAAVERVGEDLFIGFARRKWRIRAAGKSSSTELRVNLLVRTTGREGEAGGFFVDTVDLYSARQRAHFTKYAAEELGASEAELRREVGEIVLGLESERRAETAQAAAPKDAAEAMSEEERAEALALLRDPRLCERIVEDLAQAGIVGEDTNKLVTYVAATSRKLEEPLAVVIQSSSAAGKSSLMEAVLALMPEEERVQYSAMTGQSLFYMSGQHLKHKILAIVEEEGAERASYALKLLQSEGELTIASTGKDPATGRHVTQTYRVEGPVMIVLTTTASEVDEELLNRCLVISVDEGEEQTLAIHARQRRAETLEGRLEREDRLRIRRLHRNAQRLLEPILVVNPYAPELDFASHVTRTRRDHMKYLTLIRAVTLLHQHQRPQRSTVHRGRRIEYIEATREDVEIATRLARAVLGRSLDELPPQTRRLLGEIVSMVAGLAGRENVEKRLVRFSQRDVREHTHWGQTQIKVHMKRLEEHEYVLGHRGRGPVVMYELAHAGDDGERMVIGSGKGGGTSTYERARSGSGGSRSGSEVARSGSGRASVGPALARSESSQSAEKTAPLAVNGAARSVSAETH